MDYLEQYDLGGIRGPETFRDLPEGLIVELSGGATGEIIANARDGAFVEIRILTDPDNPDRVGSEEMTYFPEVLGVISEGRKAGSDDDD